MTTELTKAAQRVLDAYDALDKLDSFIKLAHEMAALRALTQRPAAPEVAAVKTLETLGYTYHGGELWKPPLGKRPAAQTEREAFEAWWPTVGQTIGKVAAWEAWHARAMLATQQATPGWSYAQVRVVDENTVDIGRVVAFADEQATPEPGDDAQIRAIGEGLRSAHDHIEMHRLERSHCKDAERIREGLAAFSAYKKRGDFAATPEPVGEPDLDECPHLIWFDDHDMSPIMFAGAGARAAALQKFKDISGAWNAHLFVRVAKNSRDDQYPCAAVATRPAPGVPEGWQPIQTAPTDGTKFLGWRRGQVATAYRVQRDDCEMWCFGGKSGAFEHWPEIRPEFWMPHPPEPALAAAQAKGGV